MARPGKNKRKQVASTSNDSVVIMQQGNDNVTIVGGIPFLHYTTPQARRKVAEQKAVTSDLWLLRADTYATPMFGREEILSDFLAWAKTPGPSLSIRTITGAGGSGKTRFALELLAALRANECGKSGKLKPDCGFVLLDKLEAFDMKELQKLGEWLESEDLQALATRVSTGDECSIIIQDGVGGDVKAPAPPKAPASKSMFDVS